MTTAFIISAPSGSGKSTLVRWLLDHDKNLQFSISYTTRQPRGNEITGSDYHFIDRPEFEQKLANGDFLEHAEVFGNYYGTHRDILEQARNTGKDVILDIDIEGARQLKEKLPQCISIFVLAPSRQVLEERLRARSASERKVQSRIGEDTEVVIQKRLRKAADEIRNYSRYDYVLVNDDLARSKETLACIVAAERVRRIRVEPAVQAILASFGQ